MHSSWHQHPDMQCKKAANILWNGNFFSTFTVTSSLFESGVFNFRYDSRPGFSTTKSFVFEEKKKREGDFFENAKRFCLTPLPFVLILSGINVANTQEYILKFPDVKRQLLCWLLSKRDKNRQPLPWQKWNTVKFEFKHDSNLKLSGNAENHGFSAYF